MASKRPDNLEQRSGLWYAVVMVPKDVQAAIGKGKFIQSLKTHSQQEARLRSLPLISRWKAEIKKARGSTDALADEAMLWKRDLATATRDDGENEFGTEEIIVDALVERAETIAAMQGSTRATDFYNMALGKLTPLGPLYETWKGQLGLAQKTMDQMGRDVQKLVAHFKGIESITPRAVNGWVDKLIADGHTNSSIERILNACRSLWRYLRETSEVDYDAIDPFVGIMDRISRKVAKNRQGRVAWAPEQVATIYAAAIEGGDTALADTIALGAYTGARINELATLTKDDVTPDDSLLIRESKTEAGIREVPVHPAIKKVIERLVSDSQDGYLIPTDAKNKYGNRGDVVGKRFGRLKTSLGFPKKSHVFHSIRKTLITLLENAGVPEGVAADIAGHEKKTMTYGVYSAGSQLEIKRKELAKVSFPGPLQDIK